MRTWAALVVTTCLGGTWALEIEPEFKYPKRSNEDAALLEWGSSAIIHNADGVVSKFGPSATHPEFELGIEAELVTASPRQGCEPLSNARTAATQIVVMTRGSCTFGTKAKHAAAAGAAALIVVNNDRRSPDRAFAMGYLAKAEEEERRRSQAADEGEEVIDEAVASMPSVMISYAAGQQLREHNPRRMRLFAGGGRPFIESVTDAAPVLYLVHNAMTGEEIQAAVELLTPALKPRAGNPNILRAHRTLGALRGSKLNAFYERISSIVGHPMEYLGDLALERRLAARSGERDQLVPETPQVRDERRLSRFNSETGDDGRAQTVMTCYVYLNASVDADDGGLYFPRARPAPVRIAPQTGLAAVWYSALEDGGLDRTAAHFDGPPRGVHDSWVLHMRVYAQPRTLARRLILPLLLVPFGPAGPNKTLVLACHRFFARSFGEYKADAAIDLALYLLALVLLSPLLLGAFVAYSLYEQSKVKPKKRIVVAAKSDAPQASNTKKSKKPKHA